MNLLILTQKVDRSDGVLGFFHRWIIEFAQYYEKIIIVCLYRGSYNLPENVKVLSLGKETGENKLKYIYNFYKYIITERKNYNSIFVHMNQEYVLLGFLVWKLLGKNIFLWRNHTLGSFLTNVSALFCKNTFCTSKFAYMNRFKNNIIMPVGIDTEYFFRKENILKNNKEILFLSRISPNKKLDILIEALKILKDKNTDFHLSVVGKSLKRDEDYSREIKSQIKDYDLEKYVEFFSEIPNYQTIEFYNKCGLFVNLTSSGSYDKTILEAMSCEENILVCNENLKNKIQDELIFIEDDYNDLAKKIENLLLMDSDEREKIGKELRQVVIKEHDLKKLMEKLIKYL